MHKKTKTKPSKIVKMSIKGKSTKCPKICEFTKRQLFYSFFEKMVKRRKIDKMS